MKKNGDKKNRIFVFFVFLWLSLAAAAEGAEWTRCTKLLGTSSSDIGYGIAVDSNGNSYITGYTNGGLDGNNNAGGQDIFVAKYDTNGNKQWTRLLGTSKSDIGWGIAVDSNGNSYVTGTTGGDLDGETNAGAGNDIFITKYDTNGNNLWTRLLGTTSYEEGMDIAVDSNGNSYVTGATGGDLGGNINAGNDDIFVAKYDTNGNRLWTSLFGTLSSDAGAGIAVDSNGNSYVTGSSEGNLDGNPNGGITDIFVAKYDTNGARQWTSLLGAFTFGTEGPDMGLGIAVDSNGNSYVTGITAGNLDAQTNAGGGDILMIYYDTNGNKLWVKLLGTSSNDLGWGIAVDSNGNSYITGYTMGNPDGQTNAGGYDIFVWKLSPDNSPPMTTVSPPGGTYTSAQLVTLSCIDDISGCAKTYYNPAYSDLNFEFSVYDGSTFAIAADATVKFFSFDNADNGEALNTVTYVIDTGGATAIPTLSEWGMLLFVLLLLLSGIFYRKGAKSPHDYMLNLNNAKVIWEHKTSCQRTGDSKTINN